MLAAAANIVFIVVLVAAVTITVVSVPVAVIALVFMLRPPLVLLSHWLVVACCLPLLLASLPLIPL